MRAKTRIAAWAFFAISVLAVAVAWMHPSREAAAAGMFPALSAGYWLMAALQRKWREASAVLGAIQCGCSVIMFLLADWHPFGISWAILIPAWLVLVGLELLVIRGENRAQQLKEKLA